MKPVLSLLLVTLCISTIVQAQDSRTYIGPRSTENPTDLPFSGAVLVGNTLYMSGVLGTVDGGIPEDAAEEATSILEKMRATLKDADMTMDDLVYVQVFCSDVEFYAAFNTEYKKFFTKEYPARAFVGAGTLLLDARFEVQGIAVRRQ
jgi:2-iminobutanoate/2-iminopropanoate deaminase